MESYQDNLSLFVVMNIYGLRHECCIIACHCVKLFKANMNDVVCAYNVKLAIVLGVNSSNMTRH
jgi:hypothetical protein